MGFSRLCAVLTAVSLFCCAVPSFASCKNETRQDESPGFVLRITKAATNFLNQEIIEVIQVVLKNTTFPSVQDNSPIPFIGTVYYSLADLRITDTAVAQSEIVLLEGYGLSFYGKDIEIVVQGKVSYEYRSWLTSYVSNRTILFTVYTKTSLNITSRISSPNGTFLIEPPSCHLHIDDLQLRLAKNENLGIQFLGDMLTIPIRQLLRIQVCSELRNVGKELSFRLQTTTDKLTLDDRNELDVSLLSCPLITKDYIETRHKGWMIHRGEVLGRNGSILWAPLDSVPTERMMGMRIAESVLESLAHAFFQENLLRNFTWDDVEEVFGSASDTTGFLEFCKKVLVRTGGKDSLEQTLLTVSSPRPPKLSCEPAGIHLSSTIKVDVTQDGGPVLFSIQLFIKTISFAHAIADGRRINGTVDTFRVKSVDTSILTPEELATFPKLLRNYVKTVAQEVVLERFEREVFDSINHNGMDGILLVDPVFNTQHGYLQLETNISLEDHFFATIIKQKIYG